MKNYFKNQEIEEAAYKRSICTNFVYMYIYKRESELGVYSKCWFRCKEKNNSIKRLENNFR